MKRLTLLFLGLLLSRLIFAAYVENVPQTIKQPNGKVIQCLGSGDEYYHWLHDANGYTIVMNPQDGYFYYGIRSGGSVVPSKFIAGEVNPATVGLEPWAKISEQLYAERKSKFDMTTKGMQGTPTKGIVNTISIFISFADDSVFTHNRAYFKSLWNRETGSSVRDYFNTVSYGELDMRISHFPISPDTVNVCYKDMNPRGYYEPKSASNTIGYEEAEVATREHNLLKRAVEYVQNQIPDSINVDMNADGVVDNVCFTVQGNSSAWSDLLWPHKWSLYSVTCTLKGARITPYFLTMENGFGTGTMCHELTHVFGAPDLYHYSSSGKTGPAPVGSWCLMAGSADPPQGVCGYLRLKYNGWISELPEITESGTYSLKPLMKSATHNLYKIASPYSKTEFFVLEYRVKEGRYEVSIPGSGLLVYRINTSAGGNASGPPDEVYIYRPGGNLTDAGALDDAAFGSKFRKEMNDKTDPECFLYNGGQGSIGGLDLLNISDVGDSISFEVRINHFLPPCELKYVSGNGILDLSWKKLFVDGLTTYIVYRNGVRYGTTTNTSFRDSQIEEGTPYTYWVTAYYDGEYTGESEKSNEVTYTATGVQSIPYKQDFESVDHGWKIKGNVEGFQWGDATSLNMSTLNTTKFLGACSVNAGAGVECSDYAISPRMNLFNKSIVYMHFDYALKRWQQLDHLKIFWRRLPTESWVQIIDLPTSGTGTGYKWRKYNLELPSECYTEQVQFGFQYDDGGDMGYGAAIDNVVVDEQATSGTDEIAMNNTTVNVYPNPAGDQATLSFNQSINGPVNLKLINLNGQTVWSTISKYQTSEQESINLKGLGAGTYYLVIETEKETIVKPLVKK